MSAQRFKSRKEVFDFFSVEIARSYYSLHEHQRLEWETNLLKTYVIEVDYFPHNETINEETIKDLFTNYKRNHIKPIVKQVDTDLFELTYHINEEEIRLFVDKYNERFWFVHTLGKSENTDPIMRDLVLSHPELDFIWLNNKFLWHEASKRERILREVGISLDQRDIFGEESANFLKFRFSAQKERIKHFLKIISKEFENEAVLRRIKFKEFVDGTQEEFIISKLTHTGKVTSTGTSIQLHHKILTSILAEYEQTIKKIESLRFRLAEGNNLEGSPIQIVWYSNLPKHTFEKLIRKLHNGSSPFRLLGFASQLNDYEYILEVTDLHIGQALTLQVFPNRIIIYLHEGVCGNSVLRIFSNLQHIIGNKIKMLDYAESTII